jgi:hypothetical protein
MGALSYDERTRHIGADGGALVVVFWGNHWSPRGDGGHAKAIIETDTFLATVSSREETGKTRIESLSTSTLIGGEHSQGANDTDVSAIDRQEEGHVQRVSFLEKSVAQDGMWAKYVIFIDDA